MGTNKPMLPKEAINQFKKIYMETYHKELSDQEATLKANNLFELYKAVYGASDTSSKVQSS